MAVLVFCRRLDAVANQAENRVAIAQIGRLQQLVHFLLRTEKSHRKHLLTITASSEGAAPTRHKLPGAALVPVNLTCLRSIGCQRSLNK
jgi:hypothetical protein